MILFCTFILFTNYFPDVMDKAQFYSMDPWLKAFTGVIEQRISRCVSKERKLTRQRSLADFAMGHYFYGLLKKDNSWIFREWAPNATDIYLIGTFNDWKESSQYRLSRMSDGDWEIILPGNLIHHGDLYKLSVHWDGGHGERIPSYAVRVVQDEKTKIFSAQVWDPEKKYKWVIKDFKIPQTNPLIYEAHVGMSTPDERIGTYAEFTKYMIPRIAEAGYNTIQLMAIQEHPYYGSFGYHVSSFFAASSKFGTPEELKELIDVAHQAGLIVIMDIVHSHSVKNINEGLGLFDGSQGQYFHTNERRYHKAWDSLCFDYGKDKVIHFLLSNCRYWLEEYKFDGFRFDGVTSMIYYDHGLEKNFTEYIEYFNEGQDIDALIYLYLANKLIHQYKHGAVTIAEEMSGMPGIAASTEQKGFGFDYRMSMGVPDFWIKLVKEVIDENWDLGKLTYELLQKRPEEKVISYCESHDQALVGDKTLIFRMIDAEMYTGMSKNYHSLKVDRGIALHKMIRLMTFATAGGGYLNFMGNEFGHPEWIDFPRQGNNWSYKYARRQWNLAEDKNLKYSFLAQFDCKMTALQNKYHFMEIDGIMRLYENNNDKIIAFARGDLMFVFNFNPAISFTDYGIPVKGKYRIVLDTDDLEFGGFGRIDKNVTYSSIKKEERYKINAPFKLYLYLPARTAIVFHKIAIRKVTDI